MNSAAHNLLFLILGILSAYGISRLVDYTEKNGKNPLLMIVCISLAVALCWAAGRTMFELVLEFKNGID